MFFYDWFYEEFGFKEKELANSKDLADFISFDSSESNKFNKFSSLKNGRTFYPGRFDCLTNENLYTMLKDIKSGKSSLNPKDFCFASEGETDKKPILEEKMSENVESEPGAIQEEPIFSKEFQEELSKKLFFGFKEYSTVNSLVYCKKNKEKNEYENEEAVFQMASQFNCLEMVGPAVTPRDGITRYINDNTQGPECALCCRSATFYRNYLVKMGKKIGQMESQINLLDEVDRLVNNEVNGFWFIQNGYCLTKNTSKANELHKYIAEYKEIVANEEDEKSKDIALKQGLKEVEIMSGQSKMESEGGSKNLFDPADIIKKIKVGIQWEAEVSEIKSSSASNVVLPKHRISQVLCSAMALAYDRNRSADLRKLWDPFCKLILQGQYEAVLMVAGILAYLKQKRINVYLTAVGGGVFGNPQEWIRAAIQNSINKHSDLPLNVYLVSLADTPYAYREIKLSSK